LGFQNYHSKGCTFYVDDVSLDTNLAAMVELVQPTVPNQPLGNNMPTFRWQPAVEPKYLNFELCYAKSRTFPARGTTVVPDLRGASEFTLDTPLDDGVWYWKLRFAYNNLREGAVAEGESAVALFRVKSDGQDRTAPRVAHWGPTRIEDASTAEVVVQYQDNPQGSGVNPASVKMVLDGVDVTDQCEASGEKLIFRPKTLNEAVHRAEVTLADKAGNETTKKWWFLVKKKPDRGIVSWDSEQKIFLVDGEPFFPFGMYQYRHTNPYDTYRDWGFNTVHFYDGTLPPGVRAASQAGLKVFALATINRGVAEQASLYDESIPFEENPALRVIAERIFEVCNEPSLFCWSIRDEPDKVPLSPVRLRKLHEFIKSLDPYHLTDVVLMKYGAYYSYAGAADLIVGDVYPYSVWTGKDNPEMIWDEPIHQDRAQGGDRPVLTILQHFGGREGSNFPHLVPTGMRRFMAYLSYIHGTRGMMWYAYGSSDYGEAPDYPEQWEDMKHVAGEFAPLLPMLLSDDAPEKVQMRVVAPPNQRDRYGNPAIHYTMKSHDGKRYLITANAAAKTVRAAFRIAGRVNSVREIHEDREVDVVGSQGFIEEFQPRSAHVFELTIPGSSSPATAAGDAPSAAGANDPVVRTWTDLTGRYRVDAALVEIRGGVAHLRKPDGAQLRVPLNRLSDGDRQYARGWLKNRKP
jgi:hypothetical protein